MDFLLQSSQLIALLYLAHYVTLWGARRGRKLLWRHVPGIAPRRRVALGVELARSLLFVVLVACYTRESSLRSEMDLAALGTLASGLMLMQLDGFASGFSRARHVPLLARKRSWFLAGTWLSYPCALVLVDVATTESGILSQLGAGILLLVSHPDTRFVAQVFGACMLAYHVAPGIHRRLSTPSPKKNALVPRTESSDPGEKTITVAGEARRRWRIGAYVEEEQRGQRR